MAAAVGGDDGGGKKKKKGRGKRGNPPIDMTPMVDLGFLLLTFFVLTTNMSNPTVMPVVVPASQDELPKGDPPPPIPASKVLNILVSGTDATAGSARLYYYQGVENVQLGLTTSKKTIRDYILMKQKEVAAKYSSEKDPLIVLIRMTEDAKFDDMVSILDEMNITNHKRYMILDITPEEVEFIRDYEEKNSLPSSIVETLKTVKPVAEAAK
jgi:biopolymer transport protein ExbD